MIAYMGLFAVINSSCDNTPPFDDKTEMPLVVEGWIEDGEHPVVIVTRAVDLSQPIGDFEDYVEKWCRVTVSDGDNRQLLVGRLNPDYTPDLVFTTVRIRGEKGKRYELMVETDEETIVATTTVLPSLKIDSLKYKRTQNCDFLYQINAFANIEPSDSAFYKFFVKVKGSDKRFYSSFAGTFKGSDYDAESGFNVMRGIHQTYSNKFTPYFEKGDTVEVKLCRLTEDAYDFWLSYENSVSLSTNVFFNIAQNCPSNIKNGKGYWFGYGMRKRTVIIK